MSLNDLPRFPKTGLIVIAGNPGTGKTMFAVQSICNEAIAHGRRGLYVSFVENRHAFFENVSQHFPWQQLEERGVLKYLDLITVSESGIPTILEMILEVVDSFKPSVLVIDSFSALGSAFKDSHDARIVLHTVLDKLVRARECLTLLIVEGSSDGNRVGLGFEDFVADGVIILRKKEFENKFFRELEVSKFRGVRIEQQKFLMTLEKGFQIIPPLHVSEIKEPRPFDAIPDTERYFSTGSPDFDRLLNGGFEKGTYALFEIEKTFPEAGRSLLSSTIFLNAICLHRGVIVYPRAGRGLDDIELERSPFLQKGHFDKYVRTLVPKNYAYPERPSCVILQDNSMETLMKTSQDLEARFKNETAQYPLCFQSLDMFEANYGRDLDMMVEILNDTMRRVQMQKALHIGVAHTGQRLLERITGMVQVHLKFMFRNSAVVVYGVKPPTILSCIMVDSKKGYPNFNLISIV